MARLFMLILIAAATTTLGCSISAKTPTPGSQAKGLRDPDLARQHLVKGIELLNQGDLDQAQLALELAVEADNFSGIAHNNLGMAYFQQGKLYQAAWQFEYAAKLLPYKAEPRNNLGLVLEAVGKVDQAIESYSQSLTIDPGDPRLLGNFVRARIRRGDKGEELNKLLNDLLIRETRPDWVRWTKRQLVLRGQPDATD